MSGGCRHLRGEDRNLSDNSQLIGPVLCAVNLADYGGSSVLIL